MAIEGSGDATFWERLAPLTGLAAAGFFVAEALVAGDTPTYHDPAAAIVAFWRDDPWRHELSAGFMALSAVSYVWFGASVRSALARPGGGAARLASIAQAGTILIAAGLSVYASVALALAHTAGDVSAPATQTLATLSGEDLYPVLAVGTALLMLATAVAVMRFGVLPRWFGWVSVLVGVVALAVVFLGALLPGMGYVAWLATVLWVPTLSILIYRRQPA